MKFLTLILANFGDVFIICQSPKVGFDALKILLKNKSIIIQNDSFGELLNRTMSESLILFGHEFYKQHDIDAMGSRLVPTLANVFLCYHEKIWLQNCSSEFKPVIYRRYVDDTFLLFRSKHYIEKF